MIRIKAPHECSAEEKINFIKEVKKGHEVDPNNLEDLVERSKFLAFYEKTNVLVGVGGIKQPYVPHRNRIFENAKSNEMPEQYKIELGWVFVEPEFRRQYVGTTIVRELLGKVKGDKIYATTRTDNDKMKRILEFLNFHESGKEYKSRIGKQSLVLFVRDC